MLSDLFWSSTRTSVRIPTRSTQYPGKLSGRKPSGFPVRSPRLCRTRLKIPIPSSAGETNQNMTRSSHRKWGQAINACPHPTICTLKSYYLTLTLFLPDRICYNVFTTQLNIHLFCILTGGGVVRLSACFFAHIRFY